MKRILCLMLALVMVFSLVACGNSGNGSSDKKNNGGAGQHETDDNKETKEDIYQKALQLRLEKKYDEAIELFESLGDYSKAKEMIQDCKYAKAAQLVQSKNFEAAYNTLLQIKDYKNSAEILSNFVWKYTKMIKTDYFEEGAVTHTYTYDDQGYPIASEFDGEYGQSYTYVNEYDSVGRISRTTSTSASGYVTITNYKYDAAGNLERRIDNYNNAYVMETFYTYDANGVLIREEIPETESVLDYTYDEHGNLTSTGYSTYENTYNELGQLVKCARTDGEYTTVFEYTYGEKGQVVKEVATGESGDVATREYSGYICFYRPN